MNTKKMTGLVGSILLGAGVFTPMYSTVLSGNVNYYANSGGDGAVVLLFAIISFIVVCLNKYKPLWFTGVLSLALLGSAANDIYKLKTQSTPEIVSDMIKNSSGGEDMFLNTLKSVSDATIEFQWGWAVLFLGLIFMFTSVLLKKPVSENDVEIIEEGMTIKQFVIKFAWLYPLLGIVIGAIAKAIGVGVNTIGLILVMAVMLFLLEEFGKKNKRYLTKREEKTVFWLVLCVYLAIQGAILLGYLGMGKVSSSNAMVFAFFLAVLLGSLMISFPIRIMKKNLIKRNIIEEQPDSINDDSSNEVV